MTGLGFPQMEHIIPPGERGIAKVVHQELSEMDCLYVAALFRSETVDKAGSVNVGLILNLEGKRVTMMSDARHERETCQEVVEKARGRVLIAGLGLGMILHPICTKPEVESVTVIERYRDVIDLVAPTLTGYPKLRIVEGDIFTWEAGARQFDTIWFDIWPGWGAGNLPEIFELYRRYRKNLAPGGWMDAWMRRESCRKLRYQSAELHRGRRCIAGALHRLGIKVPKNASISFGTVCEGVDS